MPKIKKIARSIDPLGRITIPREILRNGNIPDGALFNIDVEGDKIILTLSTDSCMACSTTEDLICVDGNLVCKECAKHISESLSRSPT